MGKIAAYLFILSLISQNLYSIDTNAVKFFPLTIGNIYTYKDVVSSYGNISTTYYKKTIVKDTVFNNHQYFLFQETPSGNKKWYRIDTLTNNLMRYDSANSCPFYQHDNFVDSLSAKKGDSERGACSSITSGCNDTSYVTIFGIESQYKVFGYSYGSYNYGCYYAKNIGFYHSYLNAGPYFGLSTSLTGCVLNGIVYGDTSMPVGINQISSQVPLNFILYQNYPNPFNPSTIIKYSVKKTAYVILKIYSISGEEISAPVNQLHQPGTYSIEFYSSGFASGVYFYRMDVYDFKGTGIYSESRKMLFVK